MFETFRNAWKIQDLRKKLLYTLTIIIIFRIGSAIPVPFLDPSALSAMVSESGSLFGYFDVITGGSFSRATIFALSITPYINASIIMNLLTVAIPPLERMAKEGEEGKKKINKITRFVALGIGLVMATGFYLTLKSQGAVDYTKGFDGVFAAIIIISAFTAGASLIIWLGERINERGIGNGISMILFASIVSRGPAGIITLVNSVKLNPAKNAVLVPIVLVLFLAMIAFIVLMTNAERRIPIQYAKRVVGRKMYGGQSTHIPIKVAMSGVMPIIFAMSLMSIPSTIAQFTRPEVGSFGWKFMRLFSTHSILYAVIYFFLILGFNYFYVATQYNPIEIANNLRKNNGGIPGIRPGKPTSDFITKVLSKITLLGAIFLGVIAVTPIFFTAASGLNIALGGTSILIVVGVALETVRTLESQMMMRHHKGFLE